MNIDEPRWWNLGPFVVESTGNPYLEGHHKVWRVKGGERTDMVFEGSGRELGDWSEAMAAAPTTSQEISRMDEQTIDEECTDGYGYTHRHHEPSVLSPDWCKRCGTQLNEPEPEETPNDH